MTEVMVPAGRGLAPATRGGSVGRIMRRDFDRAAYRLGLARGPSRTDEADTGKYHVERQVRGPLVSIRPQTIRQRSAES